MTGATIAWSSSDTSVAGVDGSGLITAVGNGGATITARSGPVSATASVAVEQIVASLTVAPALDSLSVGDKVTLVAKASDANGHVIGGAEVAWASADSAVATVAAGGLVTGVSAGSTMVTATAGDAVAEAVIVVGLRANSITVSPPRLLFAALGDTATLIWKGLLSS